MTTIHDVRNQAMALSASERASLAHDLILSLDDPSTLELSPEREVEIRRRLQMVREGTATGRPADEVTEAMDRVCAQVGDQKDAFVATAARRTLERSEW